MHLFLFSVLLVGAMCAAGWLYSRYLARRWGENPLRSTPAVEINDGRDFVPTPGPVVFAHHFASIAGAGPIVGPVIAVCYGWMPALLWVTLGGLLVGAVHDYLALWMTTREGGRSIATVVRGLLGTGAFVALVLFLILSLALICGTFLNLSAKALVSMVPHARLGLPETQTLFRVVGAGPEARAVIGGIASTSVIVITAFAPLVGWLYIRRQVAVWKCSLLALAICCVSVLLGLRFPVSVSENTWKLALAVYTLFAAGLPVWIFLQSRDFINVHFLYAGLTMLGLTLVVGFFRPPIPAAEALPAWNLAEGSRAVGPWWPALFITIACGAVSGFHSLCAGGTTCKQIRTERATRSIGYWAMILETFLAMCVIAVVVLSTRRMNYLADVHPAVAGLAGSSNPVLGFAMAVGNAVHRAFGFPVAVGALAGMLLIEGFVVTTLDTAIRLMRYLLEEFWRALFGVAPSVAEGAAEFESANAEAGEEAGADGIPASIRLDEGPAFRPLFPLPMMARLMSYYMVSSGLAVGLMLWFGFSGGILSLWALFATANQLLAAFVLGIGAIWLLRRGGAVWAAAIPAVFMLATTGTSLYLLNGQFRPGVAKANLTLYVADWVLIVLSLYLVSRGVVVAVRILRKAA